MNVSRWKRKINRAVAREGEKIILTWRQASTDECDPVSGAPLGEVKERREEIRGFVHFIEPKVILRAYDEIKVGDCIVDLPATCNLNGRSEVVFEIDGQKYEQKQVSDELLQIWDAKFRGQGILHTVLLRLKA